MISLDSKLVLIVFVVMTSVGLIGKFIKWFKMKTEKNKSLTKLQVRYFICYFSFMSGFIFQGPYVHQRYHETGMTSEQINNIMSCFNIVSAFWGFFIGYFCELLGHKQLIILSAIMLGLHAVCRYIGGYYLFCVASVLLGLSTASNKVVFEDWLADQIDEIGFARGAQHVVKENTALINLIINVVMTPVSQNITSKFGAKSAFFGAAILFFSSAIVIYFMMASFTRRPARKKLGFTGAISGIINALTSFEFTTFLVIDLLYQINGLLYNPRWTAFHKVEAKEKLPLSQISSTCSMSLVNGAQLLSLLILCASDPASLSIAFACSFSSVCGMYLTFENKNHMFLCYTCAALSDGGVNSAMWALRNQIYPSDIRKHIMGIIRVPASFAVTFILQFMKGKPVISILRICCCILCTLAATSVILAIYKRINDAPKAA